MEKIIDKCYITNKRIEADTPKKEMAMKNLIISLVLLLSVHSTFGTENSQINKHAYAVILAGGSGERLWPLSRQDKPKQLLSVAQDGTLLDQAIDRVMNYIPKDNIWISTTTKYTEIINQYVGMRIGTISAEPSPRNTGPAILLTVMKIAQIDPQAVVMFVPADPFIPRAQNDNFAQSVQKALDFAAAHDCIALLGVKPTFPSTGYGYIEHEPSNPDNHDSLLKIVSFREKPAYEKASEYVQQGLLWNMGMFCGKVSVFIDEFKTHAPEIYTGVATYLKGDAGYDKAPSISIDYAIMEKSSKTFVLPMELTWYDVGNLQIFLSLKEQHEGLKTELVSVDSQNNLVDIPDMLVALVGVNNLCITKKDNILVIAKDTRTEQIRDVVKQLKKENKQAYL